MLRSGGRRFSKKQKGTRIQSVRPRQVQPTVDSSFRRNSAFVSKSQREKAAQQQSITERQQLQKKRRAVRRLKRRLLGAILVGLIVTGGLLYRISSVQIISNASSRLSHTDLAAYQERVRQTAIDHTFLYQVWAVDTHALAVALQDEFPEIHHITFAKKPPLYRELVATIRFRTPVFTWIDAAGVRQYVDSEGILFARNLDPSVQDAALPVIEDQSGVVLSSGDTVLTKEIIAFIGRLHSKLPPLYEGGKIEKVIIPPATREVQIKMASQPYIIKFSSVRDLEEQASELQLLLQHLEGSGVVPAAVIDMRVPHRAFYK